MLKENEIFSKQGKKQMEHWTTFCESLEQSVQQNALQ